MSKVTEATFQTCLFVTSLNDLCGYSIWSGPLLLQFSCSSDSTELSHFWVFRERFDWVGAPLTAVTLKCLLSLETKT